MLVGTSFLLCWGGVRTWASRRFLDEHLELVPTDRLAKLKGWADDPDSPKALRSEADIILAAEVCYARLYLDRLDSGFPAVDPAMMEEMDGGSTLILLGGCTDSDLKRVRHLVRSELKALGVPPPQDQAALERWFRDRYGDRTDDWFDLNKPIPLRSDELSRRLRQEVEVLQANEPGEPAQD